MNKLLEVHRHLQLSCLYKVRSQGERIAEMSKDGETG